MAKRKRNTRHHGGREHPYARPPHCDTAFLNFTIVPDENSSAPRTYSNFCSIAHTPFDFTLTFCEVMPLSDKEIKEAETDHVVRAPVRTKIVVPVQFVPNLIAALQEHWRVYSESYSNVGWNKGPGTIQ